MQALIDFDGWRKWKDLAAQETASRSKPDAKAEARAALKAMFAAPPRTKKDREVKDSQGSGGGGSGQSAGQSSGVVGGNPTTLPARSKNQHHQHANQHGQSNSTSGAGGHARNSSSRTDSLETAHMHGSGSSVELHRPSSANSGNNTSGSG